MSFGGVHPFMLKAGSGVLFSVTPCLGGSDVLCDDPYEMGFYVDDIVTYMDSSSTEYCGTVSATGRRGTAAYELSGSGYSNCEECDEFLNGGP